MATVEESNFMQKVPRALDRISSALENLQSSIDRLADLSGTSQDKSTEERTEGKDRLEYMVLRNRWSGGIDSVTMIASDGRAMGQVTFRQDEDYGYISDLMVSPTVQGQGRATAIIGYLIEECRRRPSKKVRLSVDRSWLFKWYRKLGFNVVTDDMKIPVQLEDGTILMEKDLTV